MDDRYSRFAPRDWYDSYDQPDYAPDYSAVNNRSSAREYVAAGEVGGGRNWRERYGRDYGGRDYYGGRGPESRNYGYGGYRADYGRSARDEGRDRGGYRARPQGYRYEDRGFFDRAGDEVRSWFGDEEAERRREMDARYDDRHGNESDTHYRNWRSERINELDRDYDEYRRENAQRFHNEFGTWRTERQGQRDSLQRVSEHMEVVGSDGAHIGTVDKVRGDRIILTKSDPDAGGHHHSIPSRWIQSVDDKVTIRKSAEQAKAHWRDEDRSGALFGTERSGSDTDSEGRILNRSFSRTY